MGLDGQKITDKVTELLYMLDEGGNEFAAAVLSISLVTFLDSVNDAKITEHVVGYLTKALPEMPHYQQSYRCFCAKQHKHCKNEMLFH